MKILTLSHDIPSIHEASLVRTFYFMKYLSKKHNHELSLYSLKNVDKDYNLKSIKEYCDKIKTFEKYCFDLSLKRMLRLLSLNVFSYHTLFWERYCFFTDTYSPILRKTIEKDVEKEKIDAIFLSDLSMAPHSRNINLPSIVDVKDAIITELWRLFKNDKTLRKLPYFFRIHERKSFERKYSKNQLSNWVVVSENDKKTINSYLPEKKIFVIPSGVDTEYFKPYFVESKYPVLVFLGTMSSYSNIFAIKYFYHRSFPLIKKHVPNIKLYIVGRDPRKEVMELALDKSVVVTGSVKDVRPYLASASVIIAPLLKGKMGMINKVMVSMAMEKAVVSTGAGIHGIEVVPGKHVIIADDPKEFAIRVIELINDEELRRKIGSQARRFVQMKYSWEKSADRVNNLLKKPSDIT